MKKILIWAMLWLFVESQLVFADNKVFEGGAGEAGTVAASPYITLTEFNREYNHSCFTLYVATRGTTDSLSVIVQTNPKSYTVPEDTIVSPWRTLWTFTTKSATGYDCQCFPRGVAARDSTLEFYKYVRILYRHSVDSLVETDTSHWYMLYTEDGNKVK